MTFQEKRNHIIYIMIQEARVIVYEKNKIIRRSYG